MDKSCCAPQVLWSNLFWWKLSHLCFGSFRVLFFVLLFALNFLVWPRLWAFGLGRVWALLRCPIICNYYFLEIYTYLLKTSKKKSLFEWDSFIIPKISSYIYRQKSCHLFISINNVHTTTMKDLYHLSFIHTKRKDLEGELHGKNKINMLLVLQFAKAMDGDRNPKNREREATERDGHF